MIFRKHKYHTTLDTLPIVQWAKLNETIENEKPEYRYILKLNKMLRLPKISKSLYKKLGKIHQKLIYTIKNIDLRLLTLYKDYLADTIYIKTCETKNSLRKLKKYEALKIKYEKNEKLFLRYASFLDENYSNFKVQKYVLREDFESHFKEFYGIKLIKDIKRMFLNINEVTIPHEYMAKIANFSQDVVFMQLTTSTLFFTEFYKPKKVSINNILNYSRSLKPYYLKYKQYHKYILDRANLFDLSVIDAEPQHEYNFYRELVDLSAFLQLNIDEFETSVNKYVMFQERASREIEINKKPNHAESV